MSAIQSPISCVHCGKTFYGPRFSVTAFQDRAHLQQMQQFFATLSKHLADEHPQEAGNIFAAAAEFQTMMTLSRYRSNDTELQRKVDMSRWNVHQNTLAIRVADSELQATVDALTPELTTLAQMNDQANFRMRLLSTLQFLRDQLQEPGKYDLETVPN